VRFPKGTTEHPINSGKRKFLVSIWDFGAVHPQSERSYYICNDHPAKMRPALARAILQLYGESPVLDPMAGIGTTLVEAALLGMNAIGVEYEQKFVDQANKNIKHVQKVHSDKKIGRAVCIKGDARNLSCLNNRKANSIIFSPPYCGVMDAKRHVGGIASRDHQLAKTGSYSKDAKNIGNITQFGSIIFSPPYGEANRGRGIAEKGYEGIHGKDEKLKQRCDRPISGDPNNIGNFRFGATYLGEMFKVYKECFRVLKPGKFMVVVVKDIQRNWKIIPLGADTIKLCQLAGFDLHDVVINKKYFPSFWMLNLAKKSQSNRKEPHKFHVLKTHEYVLVFRKS
jgi:DNA modification methylase